MFKFFLVTRAETADAEGCFPQYDCIALLFQHWEMFTTRQYLSISFHNCRSIVSTLFGVSILFA